MASGKLRIEAVARANGWEISGNNYDTSYRKDRRLVRVSYDVRGRVTYAVGGGKTFYDRDKAGKVIEVLKETGRQ